MNFFTFYNVFFHYSVDMSAFTLTYLLLGPLLWEMIGGGKFLNEYQCKYLKSVLIFISSILSMIFSIMFRSCRDLFR